VKGISRRHLLGAAGVAAASLAPNALALPRSQVRAWDVFTDVLVIGSGAAGLSASIEARASGVSVLLTEFLPVMGGASTISGGVIYAGGGTSLQRALRIEDSVEAMYNYLVAAGGHHQQLDKIQRYCEDSPAHFEWLMDQGITYRDRLSELRVLPDWRESLYYSASELDWPHRDAASPVPRGHVPAAEGSNGGRELVNALLSSAKAAGVELRSGVKASQLVTEDDGTVVGAVLDSIGQRISVRARRGVVLACGGFVQNRTMLELHAPELARCSVPFSGAGDNGDGIAMGMAVGGVGLRMQQGAIAMSLREPEEVVSGLVVNANGTRFIAEDAHQGALGHAISRQPDGKAWLITDQRSSYTVDQDERPLVAQANSVGNIAEQLGFPRGSLQNTVAYYNRNAANGIDPQFHKAVDMLRPLQGPPYSAWDLSSGNAITRVYTLGGLHTTVDGQVINGLGDNIPGLYAAGRTSAGLPVAPYVVEGLSLGDCTYFGRRAGRAAAGV
jgi:succinate dehydrogenase/fumarate reductase flavoprotein subunit